VHEKIVIPDTKQCSTVHIFEIYFLKTNLIKFRHSSLSHLTKIPFDITTSHRLKADRIDDTIYGVTGGSKSRISPRNKSHQGNFHSVVDKCEISLKSRPSKCCSRLLCSEYQRQIYRRYSGKNCHFIT
jgi:hypothetical protein